MEYPAVSPLLPYLCGVGAEIGCHKGDSSYAIASLPTVRLLYCIDPWEIYRGYAGFKRDYESIYHDFRKRLQDYIDVGTVIPIRDHSLVASLRMKESSLDFVFIDGNHLYDYVLADMIAWWPLVAPGGIMAGHDYYIPGPAVHCEVKKAVDTWSQITGKEITILSNSPNNACWMVRK